MDTAMLLLGVVIGCLAGLLLTGWLVRHGGAEPFFLRLLRQEKQARARMDTRLMLHELLHRVEDLTVKTQRMDLELQELKAVLAEGRQGQKEAGLPLKNGSLAQVLHLSRQGLTAEEIACRLQLGRGEVELLLSLGHKPPWVVSATKSLNLPENLNKER